MRRLVGDPADCSFLDIGSGSGLFSLAARNLGAKVFSFDYDRSSVWCTEELRRRYRPDDADWRISSGSATDETFMRSLGQFDIVYSWGVLHHTGRMWQALELSCDRVAPGGLLAVALYNDQGRASRYWRLVKRLYNEIPPRLRPMLVVAVMARWIPSTAMADRANGKSPFARYRKGARTRGMSVWHDWVDWVGGYPFEVASPGEVFTFLQARGFEMSLMHTTPGSGCNEYVAARPAGEANGRRTSVTDASLAPAA